MSGTDLGVGNRAENEPKFLNSWNLPFIGDSFHLLCITDDDLHTCCAALLVSSPPDYAFPEVRHQVLSTSGLPIACDTHQKFSVSVELKSLNNALFVMDSIIVLKPNL